MRLSFLRTHGPRFPDSILPSNGWPKSRPVFRVHYSPRTRDAIVQRAAVMIEGQMDCAVGRTNADHRDIMNVGVTDGVVLEREPFPGSLRQPSSGHAQAFPAIEVCRILPTVEAGDRLDLKRLTVDARAERAARKVQSLRVNNRIPDRRATNSSQRQRRNTNSFHFGCSQPSDTRNLSASINVCCCHGSRLKKPWG